MTDYIDKLIGRFIGLISVFSCWFFGSFDGSLKVLVVLVVIDYITGVAGAAKKGELNSKIGSWGIIRKFLIFTIIGIAHVIGNELFDHTLMIREAVVYFYAANEGFSIVENVDKIGIPIPRIIRNMFSMLKDKISADPLPRVVSNKKENSIKKTTESPRS